MSTPRCTLESIQRLLVFRRSYSPVSRSHAVPTDRRGLPAPQLHDSSPRTIQDLITPSRIALLDLTLSPYLPEFPLCKMPSSSWFVYPGYHFIFFPTSTSEKDALEDGYEKHFAPKHPYTRRLWVSGRLEFSGTGLAVCQPARCGEELLGISAEEDRWTTVTIRRKMFTPGQAPKNYVEETRTLRYLRDVRIQSKPVRILDQGDVVPNWKDDKLLVDHTFTPTRTLLTRFSFLTHNFHRIHLDKEYTYNVEGWHDLLVHGNLSVVLVLTAIRKYYESKGKDFQMQNVKYMMLRPLFVDEPVRLTITKSTNSRKRAILWNRNEGKAVEVIINHHSM
jgi:hydroxyacyl-ACP dehydratase HTD2-like protein with hotdog domain